MTKDNASGAGMEPIGWQFRFVFPTHASNWKSVLELPMSEMKGGDGYHYERRYVYACTGSTDATRLLAESQAHNAKLEAQVERLRKALEWARQEFNGLPKSLGYDFTHLPMIDAALKP